MENEIKVNEYVRTREGIILQVGNELENVRITQFMKKEDIIKHSPNLIDLIEKKDLVNGMTVEEFDDDEGNLYLGFPIYDDGLMDCIEEVRPLDTVEIKEVITHEQIEAISYKVERK